MIELLSSSAFAYALIAGLVAADGVFPAIPGETALIGGALLAADGELALLAVIAAGVIGGFLGDNASYLLGVRLGRPAAASLLRSEAALRRLDWARDQIRERGTHIIISVRFIPVGRTASTFVAGTLAMPWRRFGPVDAIAVTAWTTYAALVGFWAGRTLDIEGPAVIAIAVVIAVGLGVAGELTHRLLQRHRRVRRQGAG